MVGLAEGRAAAAAQQGGGELFGVVPAAAAAAGRGAADAAAATPHSALRDLLVSQMTSIKSEKKNITSLQCFGSKFIESGSGQKSETGSGSKLFLLDDGLVN